MPLDAIRSLGAKMLLNKYFDFLGEVQDVTIDPRQNNAVLQIALKGEPALLRLELRYHIESEAFVLESFRCEREWLENTLNRYFAGKRLDMGDGLAQALIKVLL